ncbi:beta-hexosaminidase [mine drainage metagenome]
MHLEMKDEQASARRISELLPEKKSTVEPPPDVLNAFSILGNTVRKTFSPLDPENRTAVVYLDDTRESLVSDSFTNAAGIVSRLKETGLKLDSFTSEDFQAGIEQYNQVIVIGRNEHLKERYKALNAGLKAKRSVFISTGVPADVGLLSDEIGYISTYSTKIDTVLGAVLRAFGFY